MYCAFQKRKGLVIYISTAIFHSGQVSEQLDREEAEGSFDLVDCFLEENYPVDHAPAGIRISVKTHAFSQKTVINYVLTREQSVVLLNKVEKFFEDRLKEPERRPVLPEELPPVLE